jgi:hypothetical protein
MSQPLQTHSFAQVQPEAKKEPAAATRRPPLLPTPAPEQDRPEPVLMQVPRVPTRPVPPSDPTILPAKLPQPFAEPKPAVRPLMDLKPTVSSLIAPAVQQPPVPRPSMPVQQQQTVPRQPMIVQQPVVPVQHPFVPRPAVPVERPLLAAAAAVPRFAASVGAEPTKLPLVRPASTTSSGVGEAAASATARYLLESVLPIFSFSLSVPR